MLPSMTLKPRIAIVGAGNLGTALALALSRAGYRIEAIVARSQGSSLRRARGLADEVGARVITEFSESLAANLVWICVPDAEIAQVASALARKIEWKGRVALHSSGALASDELTVLRRRGAAIASVHPLMTFVPSSQPSLTGVSFAIEGDALAIRSARSLINDLGGRAYAIRKADKAAYHTWATFASPLFTALLATTEQVAAQAGLTRKEAQRRVIPILLQTLANYASFGAAGAFSGPFIRGDMATIERHLSVLRRVPAAREVYLALAEAALQYLPGKRKEILQRALTAARYRGAGSAVTRRNATTSKPRTTKGNAAAVRKGKAKTTLE